MRENNDEWGALRQAAKQMPMLAAGHERLLLERARAGDAAATAELVDSHRRLVVQVAAQYAREGLSVHDLVGEGVVGLLEAIQRFDLTRDVRFASYAAWWVRSCIRSFALANRRIVRMPDTRGARRARTRLRRVERELHQSLGRKPSAADLAHALGVSEHDVELAEAGLSFRDVVLQAESEAGVDLASEDEGPEAAVAGAEDSAFRAMSVHRALDALAPRERRVIDAQLFAEGAPSLASLGSSLGVSRQRVGQILMGARSRLREELSCIR